MSASVLRSWSWLDGPGVAVVAGPAATLAPTPAARASIASIATSESTLVCVTTVKGGVIPVCNHLEDIILSG
jgi:hypothetical protein